MANYKYKGQNFSKEQLKKIAKQEGKILIDPSIHKSFRKQIDTISSNDERYKRKKKEKNISINSTGILNNNHAKDILNYNFDDGLSRLVKYDIPTRLPYVGSPFGRFLVNPSMVNFSTLEKVAKHEAVAQYLEYKAIRVINSFGKAIHSDKKCQDVLRRAYDLLDGGRGLQSLVTKMLYAKIVGHSVNYMPPTSNGKMWYIKDIINLPVETVIYSVTPEGLLDYVWQYVYQGQFMNNANMYSRGNNLGLGGGVNNLYNDLAGLDAYNSYGDLDYSQRQIIINSLGLIRLKPEYTIHYVSDPLISKYNPHGNLPDTRKVYELCMMYDLLKDLSTTFASFRAMPLIVGYAGSRETVQQKDADGNIIGIDAIDHAYNQLSQASSNGFLMFAGRKGEHYEIDVIKSEGDGKVYIDMLEFNRKQIISGLGENSSEDSSYASATQQNSMSSMLGEYEATNIGLVIKNTFNKWILQNNISPKIEDFGGFADEYHNLDDQLKSVKVTEMSRAIDPVNNYEDYCDERMKLCVKEVSYEDWLLWRERLMEATANGLDNKQQAKHTNKDTSSNTDISENKDHFTNRGVADDKNI